MTIRVKVILERSVPGEKREFSTEVYLDEQDVNEEYLQVIAFKIIKYLCEKGDILLDS